MKIDYCPECKKSGLRHNSHPSKYFYNGPITVHNGVEHRQKWCPRCQKWVDPINKGARNA